MSTKQESAHATELIQCQPWCESGDGHPGETCREDQTCMGTSRIVTLSTEDASTPRELAIYEVQELGRPMHVTISHNEDHGAALTLDEARSLRDALDSIISAHSMAA